MKKYILLLLAGSVCGVASSQNVYSLEQCRQLALSQNIKMTEAGRKVEMADETKKEAFTNYFPSVTAGGGGFIANKGLIEMELAPGMGASFAKDGIIGGVAAMQPVFAGGQIVNGNKLAKLGADVGRIEKEMAEKEVSLTVENYYWQVVSVQEKLKTVGQMESMLSSLHHDVGMAVNAGLKTRNDLLQVSLKRNEVKSSRIKLENALALSKMVLAQYAGISDSVYSVASEIPEELPEFPYDLQKNVADVMQNVEEYQLLQKGVESAELQKKLEVGKHLPSVAVGAGYFYENIMDKSHSFVMGMATVSIPLTDWWKGSHAIKRQNIQITSAKDNLEDGREMLEIRMMKSWNDFNDAFRQMEIAVQSKEQAAENLRLNRNYYDVGTSTMSDLLKAQALYQQSCDGFVDAFTQYQIKRLEYIQNSGQ